MIKKFIFSCTFFLCIFLLSAQSQERENLQQAKHLFSAEKFGLSQYLYQKIYTDNLTTNAEKEDALFHIAICSKRMFNEDTKFWFDEFLSVYPYSSK